MKNNLCFKQLANAKVRISGLKDLKNHLEKYVPFYKGQPVISFSTFGSEVFVHVVGKSVKPEKHLFGYIEEVAYNAQAGVYAEGGQ